MIIIRFILSKNKNKNIRIRVKLTRSTYLDLKNFKPSFDLGPSSSWARPTTSGYQAVLYLRSVAYSGRGGPYSPLSVDGLLAHSLRGGGRTRPPPHEVMEETLIFLQTDWITTKKISYRCRQTGKL